MQSIRTKLWELGFSPEVFKKLKGSEKAKGVDIALTKDMLSHAFRNHYDVAVPLSGDGDSVPLVKAVKDQGKRVVCLAFGPQGASTELKLMADDFHDISEPFIKCWKEFGDLLPAGEKTQS